MQRSAPQSHNFKILVPQLFGSRFFHFFCLLFETCAPVSTTLLPQQTPPPRWSAGGGGRQSPGPNRPLLAGTKYFETHCILLWVAVRPISLGAGLNCNKAAQWPWVALWLTTEHPHLPVGVPAPVSGSPSGFLQNSPIEGTSIFGESSGCKKGCWHDPSSLLGWTPWKALASVTTLLERRKLAIQLILNMSGNHSPPSIFKVW